MRSFIHISKLPIEDYSEGESEKEVRTKKWQLSKFYLESAD